VLLARAIEHVRVEGRMEGQAWRTVYELKQAP
jgi:hypothetical protein